MMEYQVVLEEDPETKSFTATVPAIPEIVVDAETEAEALALVREAIAFALEERAKAPDHPGIRSHVARARVVTVEV